MKLKAAILGAGNMGKCHAGNLIKLGIEVTAVCDINEDARESFKEALDIQSILEFSCFDSMLEEAPFDMLFICLPPFAQEGQFQKAAKAGKHIFIEKPIALDAEEGKDMVQVARENNIITQVGFHMRWGAAVKKLVQLIESGDAGRPVLFNGQYECNSLHTPWWTDINLSGGQIVEQAIHIYDTCRYLLGHPKFASGIMGNVCHANIHDYTVEDVSASFAGFMNGAISSITATNCAVPGLWEEKFTTVFEKVTVFFENPNKARFVFNNGDEVKEEYVDEKTDPKFEEVKDFVQYVTKGEDSKCSIVEGYLSLCYVDTVMNSAKLDGIKLPVPSL
ncbi:MAG TPA: Gfo/Idh/MocA family oxidoreductase [Clostridia bacterium]|nr:Gfo/Idh/MocA family oxidoreductase [Clostridia bacterium]